MEDDNLNEIAEELFEREYDELTEDEQDYVWERMDDRGLNRWLR